LKPLFSKHVWSYDFLQDRTHNGVKFRILNVIDEFTRECLAVRVARSLTSHDVINVLTDLFIERGVPVHIRSENGPEFIAKRVRDWLEKLQVRPLYIEPGSPWENGYIESFNGKMRDQLPNLEIFLFSEGGTDIDRSVAQALQHHQATQCVGVSTISPRFNPGTIFSNSKGWTIINIGTYCRGKSTQCTVFMVQIQ